jgi:chemotaxis protein methyltransferase CheR
LSSEFQLEVRLFLEAIRSRYGYDFLGYASASMQRRVLSALSKSGAPHLGDLQHRVLQDPRVFAQVVDELTVRVSELFRDPLLFRAVREKLVPLLKTFPQVKVWHCGCAEGEEVYADAIVLSEEGLYARTQIYATDLSVDALSRARVGAYPLDELSVFRENYAHSGGQGDATAWCTTAYGGLAMHDGLKRNILFFQHDLSTDHSFGAMNVIFCRNVLIYFGRALRERVMAKLIASLIPGGYLCLGATERLTPAELATGFTELDADQRIYRYER